MKENLLKKLDKYDYKYSENANVVTVKLGLCQIVNIDFSKTDKCIISDNFIGWNFLSGMMGMSLKNTMIYNTFGFVIVVILMIFMDNFILAPTILILYAVWIIIWTFYYNLKFESFKSQVIFWIEGKE
jgi:hypothetical protein